MEIHSMIFGNFGSVIGDVAVSRYFLQFAPANNGLILQFIFEYRKNFGTTEAPTLLS